MINTLSIIKNKQQPLIFLGTQASNVAAFSGILAEVSEILENHGLVESTSKYTPSAIREKRYTASGYSQVPHFVSVIPNEIVDAFLVTSNGTLVGTMPWNVSTAPD